MKKRLLSMLLSLALLLSCVSGITLFTAADTAPYVWLTIDQTTGGRTGGGMTGIGVQEPGLGGTLDATAIGDTGKYGIKLGNTWGGFWFNAANMLPTDEDVTMLIEYYIDADAPSGSMMVVNIGGRVSQDFATAGMKAKETAVLAYPLTEEKRNAINGNTPVYITGGDTPIYVQSLQIVASSDVPPSTEDDEEDEEPGGDTEELPAPYAYMETASGTLQANFGTGPLHASATVLGNTDVVAIGDTGMYGIKLTADWTGFYVGGNLKGAVPADTDVVVAIECYATAAGDFLRFVGNSIFVGHSKIGSVTANETSLIFVEFTAEEVAAWGNDARMGFQRSNAAGDFYIKSIRMVDAQYVDLGSAPANDYYDFGEGKVLCDYYPEITVPNVSGMAYNDGETGYRYFTVNKALASSHGANEPVYIKVYTTEGNENTTIGINTYQHYKDGGTNHNTVTGAPGYTITVQDGVGGVYIPEACFTNGLNSRGSFRFSTATAAKIARIEVYKVSTYCNEATATAEMKATLHAEMLRTSTNVEKEGYVAPTVDTTGWTGIVTCAVCGEELSANTEIPQLEVYAQIDFDNADGAVITSVKSVAGINGASLVPVQIPETDAYGVRIDTHNTGFSFSLVPFGITEEDLTSGEKNLAISVEYYLADGTGTPRLTFGTAGSTNMALYGGYNDHCWDAVCVNPADQLKTGKLQMNSFLVGGDHTYIAPKGQFGGNDKFTEPREVETLTMAKALVNGSQVNFIVWKDGMNEEKAVYIKSITIYDADEYQVLEQDTSREYIDFESEFATSPVYYPQYTVQDAYGLSWRDVDEGVGADGLEVIYRYFVVTYSKVAADKEKQPVVIRFTLKEGSEVTRIALSYQKGKTPEDGLWGHIDVDVVDGVGEIVLTEAAFTNGLNGNTSFRVWNVDRNPVGRDLAMVEVYAVKDKTALTAILDAVAEDTLYKTSASVAEYMTIVEAAQVVADNAWANEEEIAKAVADLEAARALLVDCLHDGGKVKVNYVAETCLTAGYSGDMACDDCGFIADEDYGAEIPAHETEIRNVKEATCTEEGNRGDTWCLVCNKIAKDGQKIAKVPHVWDDGVVTKPATKDEAGEITKTCTVCKEATTVVEFDFEAELGDVDGNGKVDSTDARLVLQYAVKKIPGGALDLDVADVDGNGKVDSTDARLILQYAVKKIDKLPAA